MVTRFIILGSLLAALTGTIQAQYNARRLTRRITPAQQIAPQPAVSPNPRVQQSMPMEPPKEYEEVNEVIPILVHNDRVITNGVLFKVSTDDGFVRFESGSVRVKLQELPEPARGKFYHPEKIAALKQRQAEKLEAAELARKRAIEMRQQQESAMQESYVLPENPLRIFKGNLYDLSAVIWEHRGAKLNELGDYWVCGKVLSVAHEGLLLSTKLDPPYDILFLKNYPGQDRVVDGIHIHAAAFLAGRFHYESVLGAGKTVPLFEYGEPVSRQAAKERFKSVNRISSAEERHETEPF